MKQELTSTCYDIAYIKELDGFSLCVGFLYMFASNVLLHAHMQWDDSLSLSIVMPSMRQTNCHMSAAQAFLHDKATAMNLLRYR